MPQIDVPPRYRGPTNGRRLIAVDGGTLRECVDAVEAEYPGFRELIFDDAGEVRRFVRVSINGEVISGNAADAPLAATDRVAILAARAGG